MFRVIAIACLCCCAADDLPPGYAALLARVELDRARRVEVAEKKLDQLNRQVIDARKRRAKNLRDLTQRVDAAEASIADLRDQSLFIMPFVSCDGIIQGAAGVMQSEDQLGGEFTPRNALIRQVEGPGGVLVDLKAGIFLIGGRPTKVTEDTLALIVGADTTGWVDGKLVPLRFPVRYAGTVVYRSASGERTIHSFEALDEEKAREYFERRQKRD